ncbi:NhaP-type Na+/H+ or K+/H+ antiporter [Rhodococcus rhodochrous J45]|uniref:NhaP-type Na+/H+ or K+/H+ antiporter n=1 Tax=Rhodococcus rhodochrous J45 TaxID=935266 RepID=A0A562DKM7_RHORH|nr:cation:proton antiporter [Rhodococcus rhodochrous]TWH10103.1 NhaP-type Na+/H+ or K+/H+ antiporter [Rhodococcus rhodochrous J45]
MNAFVVVGLGVGLLCALGSRAIARLRLAAPLVMVTAGIVVSSLMHEDLTDLLDESATEHAVELILALLLFVDATEVRGGLFGGERAVSTRLLAVALPLALIGAVVLGAVLLPFNSMVVLVVVACVVVPTDLAPASGLLRDGRLPERVRRTLNVESGYNDGIVAPIFVVALAMLGENHASEDTGAAITHGLQASMVAGVIGVAVGFGGAHVMRLVTSRALTTPRGVRMGVVLLALVAYSAAASLSANGFIAAFVCGIAYHAIRTATGTLDESESELELAEDLATLSSMAMWFLFGATVSYLFELGLPGWEVFVFAAAALTIIRIVPVRLSLLGSNLPVPDRRAIALLGPRGTASIVFGLLAWQGITDIDDASLVLYVMTATVLGSIAFHSFTVDRVGRRYVRTASTTQSRSS